MAQYFTKAENDAIDRVDNPVTALTCKTCGKIYFVFQDPAVTKEIEKCAKCKSGAEHETYNTKGVLGK